MIANFSHVNGKAIVDKHDFSFLIKEFYKGIFHFVGKTSEKPLLLSIFLNNGFCQ